MTANVLRRCPAPRRAMLVLLLAMLVPVPALIWMMAALWQALELEWVRPLTANLDAADRRLHDRVLTASQLLTRLSLDRGFDTTDEAACQASTAAIRQAGQFTNVFYADLQGRPRCSALPVPPGITAVGKAWFQGALAQTGVAFGPPGVGQVSGRPNIVLGVRLTSEAGEPVGVIGGGIDLQRLFEEVFADQPGRDSAIGMWSDDGTLLARVPDPEKLVGRKLPDSPSYLGIVRSGGSSGHFRGRSLSGHQRDYAFKQFSFGAQRAFLLVARTETRLIQELRLVLRRGGVAILSTLLLAGGASALALRLRRPLRSGVLPG